jgi:hypothetical protein
MLELLKNYPKAGKVIKDYFLNKLVESLNNETLPEDFKETVLAMGIEDERLDKMIGNMPRSLFDVFDENGLMIEVSISNSDFSYKIFPRDAKFLDVKWYGTRKEAEQAAIADAFLTLNQKLKDNENRSDSGSSDTEVPTEE